MIKYKRVIAAALCLVMFAITGCVNKENTVAGKYNISAKPLTISVDKISSANNKVAFKMLSATYNSSKGKNTVISPLSLETVLAITQNGAGGKTKEEMKKALELTGIEDKEINENFKDIIANLNSIEKLKVKMANSIWIDNNTNALEDFVNNGKNYYEAEVNKVDFSKSKTTDEINNWVNDRTAGKIKKIMDKFEPDIAMALINTIYFNGNWKTPFDKQSTSKWEFASSDGTVSTVDMMSQDQFVEYLKGDNFSAVRLPYEDENFGMYIFLPDKNSSVDALLKDLNNENYSKWAKQFKEVNLIVNIPKLHIEFEQRLEKMLQDFGMKSAFEPDADFSKMTPDNDLHVSLVKQKCFIDVDEKGTEAAAATIVEMQKCVAVTGPNAFTADRPFVYILADKKTGLITFMGTVEKP